MAKPINMPVVGQDIETAVISEWCVKENDTINKGDIIAVVDSDKASFEVEAFESGTVLKLLYEVGDEAKVLEPIAYIGEAGEEFEEFNSESKKSDSELETVETKEVEKNVEQTKSTSGKIFATPVVKRMAKENNIDLGTVVGSGPNGRIVKEDILKIVESGSSENQDDNKSKSVSSKDEIVIYSKMRQTIANRLVESKQNIPHFYLFLDVDVTNMLQWRQEKNNSLEKETKISVNDILVMSVSKALVKYPKMNVHVEKTQLTIKSEINIGVAVSVEDGLIVPVIEKADKKSITEISKVSKEIAQGAKKGILKLHAPGTFTISNLGMFAVDKFIPIINPPEAAILGVGKAVKKVVPLTESTFGVRDILTLTLASDHRAVDGALAAQFLEEIKIFLEGLN